MFVGEFEEFVLTIERLGVTSPAPEGANCTVNVVDCPAANGPVVNPLTVNPDPGAAGGALIVSVAFPVLVSVTACVGDGVVPTTTLPKSTVAGLNDKVPSG